MDFFKEIAENWFLSEPALFTVYCSHRMCENTDMRVPFRTGKGMVQYNPACLSMMSIREIQQRLCVEMIRILLKHPYERQPLGCRADALLLGSDMVVTDNYDIPLCYKYTKAETFNLPEKQSFEWYVERLDELLKHFYSPPAEDSLALINDGGGALDTMTESNETSEDCSLKKESTDSQKKDTKGDGIDNYSSPNDNGDNKDKDNATDLQIGNIKSDKNDNFHLKKKEEILNEKQLTAGHTPLPEDYRLAASEQAELWEEDEEQIININDIINNIKDWGSLPGQIVEAIVASSEGKIDYRRVLRSFSTSVISSSRHLTRMRPNRRSEFEYMGSTYNLQSSLLVAIDVSGSVSNKTIAHFLSVIQRFFKYGVSKIDVIQFDTEVKDSVVTLKEARSHFSSNGLKIKGRGGTSFQPVFDYLHDNNRYDGLVILTDGFASIPQICFKTKAKILWVCNDLDNYNEHQDWMKKIGRVCFME